MIYTCTLNPSIDFFIEVDNLKLGETNRMIAESKSPGGKGINVSRVLKRLEINNKALGFLGGFTGKYIENELKKEHIETDFISVNEDTRINVKLKTIEETEINGQGPSISEQALKELNSKIDSLKQQDTIVLAGSVPHSMPSDFYKQAAKRLAERGVKVVVDTTKEQLVDVLPYKPLLVKPNHHELGEIFGITITSIEDAKVYGKKLVEKGAQIVIVSMGAKGTLLLTNELSLYANIPEGKLLNSVGAGDSVVAGFLASHSKGIETKEAFKFAAAAGSATAYSKGFCTQESIEQLIPKIDVSRV